MEDIDIKQQFHLLQKQVEAMVSLAEDTKLNLLAAIDSLRIELEIVKRFMEQHHPDFVRRYPALKETVTREVDPEWMGKARKVRNPGRPDKRVVVPIFEKPETKKSHA
jgi:hypothetical protein